MPPCPPRTPRMHAGGNVASRSAKTHRTLPIYISSTSDTECPRRRKANENCRLRIGRMGGAHAARCLCAHNRVALCVVPGTPATDSHRASWLSPQVTFVARVARICARHDRKSEEDSQRNNLSLNIFGNSLKFTTGQNSWSWGRWTLCTRPQERQGIETAVRKAVPATGAPQAMNYLNAA